MTRRLDQTTKKGKQMTEEPQEGSTGAPFHGVTDWHAIDWKSAHRNVRRLQARIVKATQEKRWGKVNARPRLLTHSFSGKAEAPATSDGKPGQTHPRSGQDHVEHSPQKDQRRLRAQTEGLPSPTASAHLHPQEERQKASIRHSDGSFILPSLPGAFGMTL